MLSRMTQQTTTLSASFTMLVLGLGLGMVMQVLVIAVQNDTDYRDLGVATSGATLFRLIGGSLGTAILGAIFAARLGTNLVRLLPPGATTIGPARNMSVQALAQLPAEVRAVYGQAFTASLDTVFLVATVVCAVGFVLTLFLPERPLRATVAASARDAGNEAGEVFGRPSDEDDVAAQLYACLASLADRDVQRAHIEAIVSRAKETLTPLAAWLLVESEPTVSPFELARRQGIAPERAQAALEELRRRGLVTIPRANSTDSELTASGCQVLERLVSARRAHLAELAEEWDPSRQNDAVAYLRNAVKDLVPDVRPVAPKA
jgi:hypothetical protein